MDKRNITDFYGRIAGTVETDANGDITARDFYGKILGYYKKGRNITTDFYGRIIGQGDLTASLIWQAFNEK